MQAESAIHEIQAFSLFLIAAVLLTGASVVEALHVLRKRTEEGFEQIDYRLTVQFHQVKKHLE